MNYKKLKQIYNNKEEDDIKYEYNKNEKKITTNITELNSDISIDIKLITFLIKVEIKNKNDIITYLNDNILMKKILFKV